MGVRRRFDWVRRRFNWHQEAIRSSDGSHPGVKKKEAAAYSLLRPSPLVVPRIASLLDGARAE